MSPCNWKKQHIKHTFAAFIYKKGHWWDMGVGSIETSTREAAEAAQKVSGGWKDRWSQDHSRCHITSHLVRYCSCHGRTFQATVCDHPPFYEMLDPTLKLWPLLSSGNHSIWTLGSHEHLALQAATGNWPCHCVFMPDQGHNGSLTSWRWLCDLRGTLICGGDMFSLRRGLSKDETLGHLGSFLVQV